MKSFPYFIGEYYRAGDQIFKLVESNGIVFHFECGHWCTNLVFEDFYRVKTGLQNYKIIQIELFAECTIL